MSEQIPYLKCPLCGNNFEQSFECDHDEYDLVEEIARLGELYAKEGRKTQVLLEEHSNLKAKLSEREEGWRDHVTELQSRILTLEQQGYVPELEEKLRVVAGLPRYNSVEAFTHNAELTVDDERWIKASQVEALLRR